MLPSGQQVILSDTVGFIDALPPTLIKAFRVSLVLLCYFALFCKSSPYLPVCRKAAEQRLCLWLTSRLFSVSACGLMVCQGIIVSLRLYVPRQHWRR